MASENNANSTSAASMFNNSNKEEDINEKRRPSYMPTRGLAAVLNQGLATLGEKLGKYNSSSFRTLGDRS